MENLDSVFSLSTALAILAVVMSYYSIYNSNKTFSDQSTANVIRTNYQDFFDMHILRATYPLQTHLFENPSEYYSTKNLILKACSKDSVKEKINYHLIEKAVSRRIFSMYEHSYFQWKNAEHNADKARAKFLKQVLNYFTESILRNPRLLWIWSENGYNYKVHYEPDVIDYYNEYVIYGTMELDATGPFILKDMD